MVKRVREGSTKKLDRGGKSQTRGRGAASRRDDFLPMFKKWLIASACMFGFFLAAVLVTTVPLPFQLLGVAAIVLVGVYLFRRSGVRAREFWRETADQLGLVGSSTRTEGEGDTLLAGEAHGLKVSVVQEYWQDIDFGGSYLTVTIEGLPREARAAQGERVPSFATLKDGMISWTEDSRSPSELVRKHLRRAMRFATSLRQRHAEGSPSVEPSGIA
jgi:hypothetical protein